MGACWRPRLAAVHGHLCSGAAAADRSTGQAHNCAFLADCRGGRWSGASCAPRSSSVPHTLRRCRARPSPRPAAPRAPLPPLNGRLHVASRSCFGAALCPRTSGATLLPDCVAPRRLRRDARRAAAAQRPPRATAAPAVAADMQPRPSSPFRNGAS